eukprot:scaffold5861_cov127-Skeletonema_marinoi.AAC.2
MSIASSSNSSTSSTCTCSDIDIASDEEVSSSAGTGNETSSPQEGDPPNRKKVVHRQLPTAPLNTTKNTRVISTSTNSLHEALTPKIVGVSIPRQLSIS